MQEPIYIYSPNDLDVFETLDFAQRYIEPPEVRSGAYTFYDSEGQLLEAVVVKKDRLGIEHCVIREPIEKVLDPDTLRTLIIDKLRFIGRIRKISEYSRKSLLQMSLRELVIESLRFQTK